MEKLRQRMWLAGMAVIMAVFTAVMMAGATQGMASWDREDTGTVTDAVTTAYTSETVSQSNTDETARQSETAEILLRIAMAEAESEGVEGKALVMLVVLNRVWDDSFPDSIADVVFQSGQFSTVTDGGRYYTVEPDAECEKALALIMSGWDESQGALYFESCKSDSWHSRNLTLLFEYGNHRFYS